MSTYPDDCPVAATLDAVGDRWTLLIVRDLLRGITRYGDLAALAGADRAQPAGRPPAPARGSRSRHARALQRAAAARELRADGARPRAGARDHHARALRHRPARPGRARLPRGPHRLRRARAADRLALPALRRRRHGRASSSCCRRRRSRRRSRRQRRARRKAPCPRSSRHVVSRRRGEQIARPAHEARNSLCRSTVVRLLQRSRTAHSAASRCFAPACQIHRARRARQRTARHDRVRRRERRHR